jgi:hypothetical protein
VKLIKPADLIEACREPRLSYLGKIVSLVGVALAIGQAFDIRIEPPPRAGGRPAALA